MTPDTKRTATVEVGQVWASTHNRDVAEGVRQRRIVTGVEPGYAWLRTEGGRAGSNRVALRNGKIKNHRLVAEEL